jgi:uncharacterized membrane protein
MHSVKPGNRHLVAAIGLLLLALGLRLYRLDYQSLWWDEGHSIFVATHSIAAIPTLPAMDVHPPLYFAMLNVWMGLAGDSEFSLRFLSVIFNMLTVALFWRFGHRLTALPAARLPMAVVATTFAAIAPVYVTFSQEVRGYSLFTLLAFGSTYFLWRVLAGYYHHRRIDWQSFAAYVFLTAATLYTHYFTLFLLLFQNTVWLAWGIIKIRQVKYFAGWVAAQVLVLLLFVPQLTLAFRQVTGYANPNLLPPGPGYFVAHSWQAYTAGLTIDPGPGQWSTWIIAVLLMVTWTIVLITRRPSGRFLAAFAFLLAWLLIPLAAYFVVLQQRPSFEPRYLIVVTPAIYLLLAAGLGQLYAQPSEVARPANRLLAILFTVAVALALLTGLFQYYNNDTYTKDDSAGVVRWLAEETTSRDIVFVDVPHPFHYYVDRLDILAPTRYLFVDIHTAAVILNSEAAGRERLFWITWRGSDTDPRGVIPYLAEKAGQLAGQRDFKGYRATWFDLDPAATFSLPAQLTPADITFGDVIRLDGIAHNQTRSADEPVWATLHFSLLRDTDVNYRVSVRLRDEAGQVVAQQDNDLLNDRHARTAAWPSYDADLNQTINVYLLPLPPDTSPGTYQLEAVLYNAEPPYPSEGVSGQATADGAAAKLGTVTVK